MSNQHPLHAAIWDGRTDDVLGLLAAGADPNASLTPDGKTPLMCAADRGEVEVAAALMEAGADVNRLNASGLSALCEAARNGSDEAMAIMRMLIRAGADVEGG